jgi:hypothetical protein
MKQPLKKIRTLIKCNIRIPDDIVKWIESNEWKEKAFTVSGFLENTIENEFLKLENSSKKITVVHSSIKKQDLKKCNVRISSDILSWVDKRYPKRASFFESLIIKKITKMKEKAK